MANLLCHKAYPVKEIPKHEESNFIKKVCKLDSGCWEWKSTMHLNGYGILRIKYKRYYAHRVSYKMYNGELLEGMYIDHTCTNRRCVNPKHLRQVTPKINATENTRRKKANNIYGGICVAGHSLVGDNFITSKSGTTLCRTCKRIYENLWRKKRRDIGKFIMARY